MQLGCRDEELWMDSSRGVICRGPEGPYTQLPGHVLELKDLPPTAELLQEEVLVRFLASHKSKEADDAFMYAMDYASNDDVPERVDRPTVFSTRTETPIAVANNVWGSEMDNLVNGTCLENGFTRFQLVGDGELRLGLNLAAGGAWLSQAWSVFHARGVSLEDDQEGFALVYPKVWLDGNLNDSPSKCQQQRQQAIYLFVDTSLPNLHRGKTSSLHHWSFQEDGHPQLSPELCCNLDLPVQLNFISYFFAYSWSTGNYKLVRQYQTLQGFNLTTADFARHLGYGNIFYPVDDSDHFDDVHEDQISPSPQAPTSLGESLDIVNSEYPSNMLDLQAEDMVVGDPPDRGDEYTKTSYHNVPNKRRRTGLELVGIETRNHLHYDFCHNINLNSDEQVKMDAGLRPMRPLPIRNPPFSRIHQPHYVQRGASASQLHSLHYGPPYNQVSHCYPSLPTGLSPRDVLSPYGSNMSTAGIPKPFSLPTHTIVNAAPSFSMYITSDDTHPVTNPLASGMNSPYSDPSVYSVTTTEYDANAGCGFEWSGDQRSETPIHCSGPSFIAPNSSPIFDSHPASTLTVSYPSHSYVHPPYSSYGGVASPPGYPSGFPGGSIGPQRHWCSSVMHSQQQSVPSHSWVGPDNTPLYGRLGYRESSERGSDEPA
ncbi:hypothetical protein PM082_014824 [Marasmius tenuissimus]|nr:hypothetical protein PM082_014824 [Marasmius tenuissimus]